MLLCALSIFGIVALIATELVMGSQLTWHQFGMSFFSWAKPFNRHSEAFSTHSDAA